MLQAIETSYRGYRFRSRLEARWAVFFDVLEIEWEYEVQGFVLGDGQKYLPDFWLSTFNGGMWAEVKPAGTGRNKWDKPLAFVRSGPDISIWLCEGMPAFAIYKYLESFIGNPCGGPLEGLICGIPNFGEAYGENRMYGSPCEFECSHDCCEDMSPVILGDDWAREFSDEIVVRASCAAQRARFEYGETGYGAKRLRGDR